MAYSEKVAKDFDRAQRDGNHWARMLVYHLQSLLASGQPITLDARIESCLSLFTKAETRELEAFAQMMEDVR